MEHASVAGVTADIRRPARLLRLASDERLVALVRRGDEAAFEALYDRHHGPILGFCRHMLGTREEAEDAVQHTFLAAFRDLARHDKPVELRAWLFAIARNRCLSLLRARREHVALELAAPATDGLGATVEQREDVRELLADLALLPEDQRAALLLAELGALDHAHIATVLGCSREKVKALVFQARSSLAASREARATPCEQIRIELATATGGTLRRGTLRRHLRACEGCRAFKVEVATQRKLMALALPIVPSLALKASVLTGVAGTHAGAGAAAAGAAASGGVLGGGAGNGGLAGATSGAALGTVTTGAAKVTLSLIVAGAIAGGGAITTQQRHDGPAHPAPRRADSAPAATWPTTPAPAAAAPASSPTPKGRPGPVPATAQPAPPRTTHPLTPADPPTPTDRPDPAAAPPAPVVDPSHPGAGGGGRATPPGHGRVPPGHAKDLPAAGSQPGTTTPPPTAPGSSGNTPGHTGAAPGNNGNAPGHTGAGSGNNGNAPGHTGAGPGNNGNAPGQSGAAPGNGAGAPGNSGAAPGNGAAGPGQSGAAPGNSGNAPGHAK